MELKSEKIEKKIIKSSKSAKSFYRGKPTRKEKQLAEDGLF